GFRVRNNGTRFEALDLQPAQLSVGLEFVFAIAGAAILAHAAWRKSRLRAWSEGDTGRFEGIDSHGERADAPCDVRVETIAAFIVLALGAGGIIYLMVVGARRHSWVESNTVAR